MYSIYIYTYKAIKLCDARPLGKRIYIYIYITYITDIYIYI